MKMKTIQTLTDTELGMSVLVKVDEQMNYTVVLRDDDSGMFAGVWKCKSNKDLAMNKAMRLHMGVA